MFGLHTEVTTAYRISGRFSSLLGRQDARQLRAPLVAARHKSQHDLFPALVRRLPWMAKIWLWSAGGIQRLRCGYLQEVNKRHDSRGQVKGLKTAHPTVRLHSRT